MTPAVLPQAAPRGFPRNDQGPITASDHGNAVHGLARAGNRLSARFGSAFTAPQRDHVLDRLIREADGASPQAAPRLLVAPAFRGGLDHEPRPQRRDAQHEAQSRRKSSASLVARLACGLFKQRRDDEAPASRNDATTMQIIPRHGAETPSRGLDEHASLCRGSSWRPPENHRGAQPHHFHSNDFVF